MIATALALAAGCGRCSSGVLATDAATDAWPDTSLADQPPGDVPFRLPKRDWNGLGVMMRENEVKDALFILGFALTPSRQEAFPVLDAGGLDLRLVEQSAFCPMVVAYETTGQDSSLRSVYGLRLWFFRNRLFAFQPVYFVDPVDLVEPGDEALSPAVMEKRLEETFGAPQHQGEAVVHDLESDTDVAVQVMVWQDGDLAIHYRRPLDENLPTYDLVFFSPGGNEQVRAMVDKRLSRSDARSSSG